MLVKKGQNNKIINLHEKRVIYTSRFVYIHQDSYIYIKIRIYTTRFVYIHQDSNISIKICIYTARFVYIHQDSYIYSKIRIYTSRFVYIQQDSYIYIKVLKYTLRFVQFGHKGKHDRWIDYRVFKRPPKNGSKMRKPSPPCFAVFTEMTASNVVVRFWAHGMSDCQRLCRGETKHGLVHDECYQNSLTLPIYRHI